MAVINMLCIDSILPACYVEMDSLSIQHKQHSKGVAHSMAQSVPLKPGQISDAELIRSMGVSRYTTRNWRIEGMPFEKVGRFIVYNEADIRPWLHDKIVEGIIRQNGAAIRQYRQHFRDATKQADDIYKSLREGIISEIDDSAIPQAKKKKISSSMDRAYKDTLLRYQADAAHELAINLQITTPGYLLAHDGLADIDSSIIEFDENTINLLRTVLISMSKVSPEDAEIIIGYVKEFNKDRNSSIPKIARG